MKTFFLPFSGFLILWLALSGHYDWFSTHGGEDRLLLFLGLFSCLLVMLLSRRMGLLSPSGLSPRLIWNIITYIPYLMVEIIKANIDVVKRIWKKEMDIAPHVFTAKSTQTSPFTLMIYANSITLTPGTISLEAEMGKIKVHTLAEELAEGFEDSEMDKKVSALDGVLRLPAGNTHCDSQHDSGRDSGSEGS